MKQTLNFRTALLLFSIQAFLLLICGCKKFVEVKAPITTTNSSIVYADDAVASSAIIGIYTKISQGNITNGLSATSLYPGLSADEFTLYNKSDISLLNYYQNNLQSSTGPYFWTFYYTHLFAINSAIEGLSASTSLTPSVKSQLLGESKFLRAFCFFYLVNFYGDVPLITTTDYKVNSIMPRTSKDLIYDQIITDLKDAQQLLSENYLAGDTKTSSGERIRPTKWAATALLSRVYLFKEDYSNAELESTKVINQTSLYSLTELDKVFLKNSVEAIWQLQPVNYPGNTSDSFLYVIPQSGPGNPSTTAYPVYLNDELVTNFEAPDQRKYHWIGSSFSGGKTYYFPYKYKVNDLNAPVSEYYMVLRLAEQYLIRAEARIEQNNLSEGISDLNTIRKRASDNSSPISMQLPALPTSLTKSQAMEALMHERRVELFTEWGHRWLDLKRTTEIETVMPKAVNAKGGSWSPFKALYPIPQSELSLDPSLVGHQNPGYN